MLPMFFSPFSVLRNLFKITQTNLPVTPLSGFDFLESFFNSFFALFSSLLVFPLCCCCCCCLPELFRLRTLGMLSNFDVFDCCLISLVDEERDGCRLKCYLSAKCVNLTLLTLFWHLWRRLPSLLLRQVSTVPTQSGLEAR